MIAIILQEGWENKDYIEQHTSGLDEITGSVHEF